MGVGYEHGGESNQQDSKGCWTKSMFRSLDNISMVGEMLKIISDVEGACAACGRSRNDHGLCIRCFLPFKAQHGRQLTRLPSYRDDPAIVIAVMVMLFVHGQEEVVVRLCSTSNITVVAPTLLEAVVFDLATLMQLGVNEQSGHYY